MDMNTGGEEWGGEERVGEAGWGVGKRKEDTHTHQHGIMTHTYWTLRL